jgi:hypothetical protein
MPAGPGPAERSLNINTARAAKFRDRLLADGQFPKK